MSSEIFVALKDKVFGLHAEGKYADALDLLEREYWLHPDHRGEILMWQGCLYALAGDPDASLAFLEEAVKMGHWWAESALRSDPDLRVLRGNPRFDGLVEVCARRRG